MTIIGDIVMTLQFRNKLHSNCKSRPVKHTHESYLSLSLKLQGKIWAGLRAVELNRDRELACIIEPIHI